jgi:hypothetical protein
MRREEVGTLIALLAATLAVVPADGLAVGERPVFEARTMSGQVVRSTSLTAKPTVVVLWLPSSPKSSRALVDLSRLAKRESGARFIALACWDGADSAKSFMATLTGVDLETWLDPAEKNASESIAVKAFKTRRFPSVYVLDRGQRVVGSYLDYKPRDDVAALIAKASG